VTFDFADDPNSSGLLRACGFDVQPMSWQVMRRAAALPWVHRDLFGRYLAAEALVRNASILSTTAKLDVFGVDPIGDYDTPPIGVTTLIKPCPLGKLG
jgi:PIN domain nuclease of toxin-antitoxin system